MVYIFEMSLNKYGHHIANMSHTAIMLHEHIDPTFMYMYAKTQAYAIPTSQAIAMYVPATNMPLKCHIYATYAN